MSLLKIYSDFQLKVEKSLETIENKGKTEMMKHGSATMRATQFSIKQAGRLAGH